MNRLAQTLLLASLTGALLIPKAPPPDVFLVKPYLQLGSAGAMAILWHTPDNDAKWSARVVTSRRAWSVDREHMSHRRIGLPAVDPHRVYRALLHGLRSGEEFEYEIHKDGRKVFSARSRALKSAGEPQRFAVFGDCGQDTPAQRAIAYQTYRQKPDFVLITGDIVYSNGRVSEYRAKYFPIYNSEDASPSLGAPLLRSTLFIGAPGNHDIAMRDFARFPDLLAYFYYWDQPLNGPDVKSGAANTPTLGGPEANKAALLAAAGETYPRMANFSFDYGSAHWTVLDTNPYVDWNDPEFKKWLQADLRAARNAAWRFVAFHHPGFNSSVAHFKEQQSRVLAPVFEEGNVDVVFSGHVHNYQRSFPLRFRPKVNDGSPSEGRLVAGSWTLDKEYDGGKRSQPKGVIYVITGGGGAKLYNPEQQDKPQSWQEFTHRFFSTQNSLTLADVDDHTATFRQLLADGAEIDRFVITK